MEHKTRAFKGFTAKYGVDRLVWYEVHDTRESAFIRERQIKEWKRAWKLKRIEAMNPDWGDLYPGAGRDPEQQGQGLSEWIQINRSRIN